MRKLILIVIPFILFFTSCKKENTCKNIDEITHEVTVSVGGFAHISYYDVFENPKDIYDIKSNTWKITFKNKGNSKERLILFSYEPNNEKQHTSAKIYVNGKMVEHDEGNDVWLGTLFHTP